MRFGFGLFGVGEYSLLLCLVFGVLVILINGCVVMNEVKFKEFKAKIQKKYPKQPLVEKYKDNYIELWGYCKRIDGEIGFGLVGKYIVNG